MELSGDGGELGVRYVIRQTQHHLDLLHLRNPLLHLPRLGLQQAEVLLFGGEVVEGVLLAEAVADGVLRFLLEVRLELRQRQLNLINFVHGQRPAQLPLVSVSFRLFDFMVNLSKDLLVFRLHFFEILHDFGILIRWHVSEFDGTD